MSTVVDARALPVAATTDPDALAKALVGDGVQILEAELSGGSEQAGLFEQGTTVLDGVLDFDDGLIFSTGDVASITNADGDANQSAQRSQNTDGVNRDDDFDALSNGAGSFDAVFLEIKFVPAGDTISLDIVFGSEEYSEYVYGGFNDSFAALLNEENIALTPDGTPIGIDTINAAGRINPTFGSDANDPNQGHDTTDGVIESANESLFVDNRSQPGGAFNTEMDGFTKTISIQGPVKPGEINTLKIGIADSGDSALNSWLLVRGASFTTSLIADPDAVSVVSNDSASLAPLENDVDAEGDPLKVTKINGIDVVPEDTVILSDGQTVTLNEDQTLTIDGNGAPPGTDSFTYQIVDPDGNVATGVVSLTTTEAVICFTPDTRIRTPDGWRWIDDLKIGDLVSTLDHGPRPIRWIGRRHMSAQRLSCCPDLRPVTVPAGAFGEGCPDRDLSVSPLHRILISDWRLPLIGRAREAFASARNLAGTLGRPAHVGGVTYIHLLFDNHEIVWANGLACESLHPGREAFRALDRVARDELLGIFPELACEAAVTSRRIARAEMKSMEIKALAYLMT